MTNKRTRKKQIKYSNKLMHELANLIVSEQRLISPLCRAYPNKFPSAMTVYRWQSQHDEAREIITDAYTMLMEDLQDEFNKITKTNWVMDNLVNFGGSERAAFEARRARMDFIKTVLTQIAPVLTPRYQKNQTIEHKGEVDTKSQIQIISYATPQAIEKDITNISIESSTYEHDEPDTTH